MKLRYGVIESTVRYARFIATWLNELSKHVRIRFQMVFGNHTELRMLGQPKGTFKDDNTGLFVREIIMASLEGNPNFIMDINPTGLIFDDVCGVTVLGIHGEVKDMEKAIHDFQMIYNTKINLLLGAHKHHHKAETVGIDADYENIPSIIGVDDYAMDLARTSRPGAKLMIVADRYGIENEYHIRL